MLMRTWAVSLIVLIFLLMGGCDAFKGSDEEKPTGGLLSGEYWRIQPVRMRVFPTTRYLQRHDQIILMARVELLDEMNDSVKGAGQFYFELHAMEGDVGGSTRRLYAWSVAGMTLEQQRTYYESVSRAYSFPLQLHEAETLEKRTVLYVTFTPAEKEGPRLDAQAVLGDLPHNAINTEPPRESKPAKPIEPE